MILRLSLDLPEDASYLRLTRSVGRTILESLRAQNSIIDDVETVLTELYSNVVRHAQSEEGRFSITLDYYAEKLVVTVADQGQGFSFKDVPPVGSARPDLDGGVRLGGFGLGLVDALSDRLEFHRLDHKGMKIRAEKIMAYESDAATQAAQHMDEQVAEGTLEHM